MFLKVVIL